MLYIVRGIPGSGKTYFCQNLLKPYLEKRGHKVEHWENDMYFIDPNGDYVWSKDKMPSAVRWCQDGVRRAFIDRKCDDVIVSNTFIKKKDYKYYVKLAGLMHQYVTVLVLAGNYQNVHNVRPSDIENMRAKFSHQPNDIDAYKYLDNLMRSDIDEQ